MKSQFTFQIRTLHDVKTKIEEIFNDCSTSLNHEHLISQDKLRFEQGELDSNVAVGFIYINAIFSVDMDEEQVLDLLFSMCDVQIITHPSVIDTEIVSVA